MQDITNIGLFQDAQGPWWETTTTASASSSSSEALILTKPMQEVQTIVKKKSKSKCHGNRKLQHFKRKCRARGLNQEDINRLIQQRNHGISEQSSNDNQMDLDVQDKKSNKRKRGIDQSQSNLLSSSLKSLSQLSISQDDQTSKKVKYVSNEIILSGTYINTESDKNDLILYKPSKYLRMPRRLLLHSLRLQLNYTLQKKNEQKFILAGLQ